jgi:hypothetical protein
VDELDVCSSADAATGEGRPMTSELEPRHVVSRFASAGETEWRRKFYEHRSSREPSGGIVRDRTNRFDRVASIDGNRSDGSASSGS